MEFQIFRIFDKILQSEIRCGQNNNLLPGTARLYIIPKVYGIYIPGIYIHTHKCKIFF